MNNTQISIIIILIALLTIWLLSAIIITLKNHHDGIYYFKYKLNPRIKKGTGKHHNLHTVEINSFWKAFRLNLAKVFFYLFWLLPR